MFKFILIDKYINESGSNLMNLAITFFGTLLAFIGALIISNLALKKQKKKEDKDKCDYYKVQLSYLTDLIENSIKNIKKQIENFDEFANKIRDKPFEHHFITVVGSNDLERLYKLDSKELFQAYNEILPKDKSTFLDYRNLIKTIDYIYYEYNQTIDSIKKREEFVSKNQLSIKKTVDDLVIKIGKNG